MEVELLFLFGLAILLLISSLPYVESKPLSRRLVILAYSLSLAAILFVTATVAAWLWINIVGKL